MCPIHITACLWFHPNSNREMTVYYIQMSNYPFIVVEYMSPNYNVLFTCKQCCNYDQSHLVMDTNTPTKFQVVILLRSCECRTRRILPIIAPYMYDGGHGAHPFTYLEHQRVLLDTIGGDCAIRIPSAVLVRVLLSQLNARYSSSHSIQVK